MDTTNIPVQKDDRFVAQKTMLEMRAKKGWTQDEVTSLIKMQMSLKEMTRQYYQKIESGERFVNPELAVGIARVFNTDVDKLFTKREVPAS